MLEGDGTDLLDLLELVDSEDSPDVSSGGSGLLSEARRVTGVPEDRK